MNNPFYYHPHPLCVKAADELKAYVRQKAEWTEEIAKGKMFGVMIVRKPDGTIGSLAAFSGILCGSNTHEGFVLPVYDLQNPDGYFAKEENEISAINRRIKQLEQSEEMILAKEALDQANEHERKTLTKAKAELQTRKTRRDAIRQGGGLSAEDERRMIKESQFQKAELKRLTTSLREITLEKQQHLQSLQTAVDTLKTERKQRSAALQQWLFRQFTMLNAKGESKDLCRIFKEEGIDVPPAGSGECCAPKLLQYAYRNNLHPLYMAEFWLGASPKDVVRIDGEFYPSCVSKCKPILKHMLQGLEVDENPQARRMRETAEKMQVVYEDQWICAVNKPSGMLSVPGKEDAPSVYDKFMQLNPDADGPVIVHRLDMDTSGILILAKNKTTHKHLQEQFVRHTVKKRYTAILEGIVTPKSGTIDLPLSADYANRPLQTVDFVHGKPAVTHYYIIEHTDTTTRVAFYPQTGRTHQLRVHSSHPSGLGCPIAGDPLYGHKSDRLYLHAESIEFTHPATGERMTLTAECEF